MDWSTLHTPIVGLSPMDGVTDAAFRHITYVYGHPDITYTEFVSAEGICHSARKLLKDLIFIPNERPMIAQIFGTTPEAFRKTAILLCELGFDGIDINMGCPANSVYQKGGGAALIDNPKLASKLITSVRDGIRDWKQGSSLDDLELGDEFIQEVKQMKTYQTRERNSYISVSVKTRLGVNENSIDRWIPHLLEHNLDMIALHGRTLKQLYGGKADWQAIAKAKELAVHTNTKILGNGDVSSRTDGEQKIQEYHVDGVLIGQASFGNPWVFNQHVEISWQEKMRVALEHAQYFETLHTDGYFLPMRKHLGWYVKSHPMANEVRQKIYRLNSSKEFEALIPEILSTVK